jgi:uncharacterized protein (DUF1778 family)
MTKIPEDRRTMVIEVTVNTAEREKIRAAAQAEALSMSAFLRSAGLHYAAKLAKAGKL